MKRIVLISIVLLGWLAKFFFEVTFHAVNSETRTLPWERRFQQKVIQGVFGGFRGVIADVAWLNVTTSWERRQWVRVQENIWIASRIQPESILFWDVGAWHLAWNASLGERNDRMEISLQRRMDRERFWVEQGRRLLEEGLVYHPHNYKLWLQLGWIHHQRRHDYGAAYECFLKAAESPGAPSYVPRLAGYALEKQGETQKAIEYWKSLLEKTSRPADRSMLEKHLLKLEKDSILFPLKSVP